MAMVLARLIGSGRVYATDITQRSLTLAREYATKEGLTNITVIEGSAASTNLPNARCDALFQRNVYHPRQRAGGVQQEPLRHGEDGRTARDHRCTAWQGLGATDWRSCESRRPRCPISRGD
jgi:hypothetical protein